MRSVIRPAGRSSIACSAGRCPSGTGPRLSDQPARDLATPADLEERASGRRPPRGQPTLYALDPDGVAELRAYFDRFWTHALAAFKKAAEQRRPQGGAMTSVTEAVCQERPLR